MRVISLFSGCGGLDLGFKRAGFRIVFANDNDRAVWETYERNIGIKIDKRSILDIKPSEMGFAEGIIGGPPCQSWSLAGSMNGAHDERGQLFYQYVIIIQDLQPLFFLAENVPGFASRASEREYRRILKIFKDLGYELTSGIVDARDYGVPQSRKRVFIVGYKKSLGKRFQFPPIAYSKDGRLNSIGETTKKWVTIVEAIGDLPEPLPFSKGNCNNKILKAPNHEYMNGSFSQIYMSRNRRRDWNEQSFTIPAMGRHMPLHPSSSRMIKIGKDKCDFIYPNQVRRLSVREAARLQTFPDDFIFYYKNIVDGYKMVGNAVPVKLAEALATKIARDMNSKP